MITVNAVNSIGISVRRGQLVHLRKVNTVNSLGIVISLHPEQESVISLIDSFGIWVIRGHPEQQRRVNQVSVGGISTRLVQHEQLR